MVSLTINTRTKQEEEVLIAFLKSLNYDYFTHEEADLSLTQAQEQEILRRDQAFEAGETTTRDWNDIKSDLIRVYR